MVDDTPGGAALRPRATIPCMTLEPLKHATGRQLCLFLVRAPGWPLALLGAWILSACMSLTGPTVITLSEADLGALVARAFPMQRRLLEVLDVQLSAPRLRLLPERNRLSVDLSLSTQDRLFGQAGTGALRFDAALRYEPRDATVRLTQVRVQQAGFDSAPAAPVGAALLPRPTTPTTPSTPTIPTTPTAQAAAASASVRDRLGKALAERVLEDLAIYTVPAERQASLRQLGLQPGAVTVTARGVEITLARAGG